jgi:hypothetical protein
MKINPHQMCFGLNLELDRSSISCFLQLAGKPAFAEMLADRLSSAEIQNVVHFLTGILKNNLSEEEYHRLFLLEQSPHHHPEEN